MIYLYITNNTSISYDNNNWYINDEPQQKTKAEDPNKFKSEATNSARLMASSELGKIINHFKYIAVLAAAGTSMDNGEQHGKTRTELWANCQPEIKTITDTLKARNAYNEKLKKIEEEQNIEDFLSFLVLYEKINDTLKGEEKDSLLKDNLEKKIANACCLKLDETNKHHGDFLRKLTARKPSEPRLQLFTTNYDTLFEQAAMKQGYTIVDGFSFSYPRVFSGINFDHDIVYRERTRLKQEESFIPNVFQLFKLHGSIDWEKEKGKIYQRENVKTPCIIYPASEKYESSYEQPYFEMMSHLQQTLRKEGTLLIIVGFGFQDKHIQNVIKEAVYQNSNFHLFIVNFCGKTPDGKEVGILHENLKEYVSTDMKVRSNVSVLFSTFKDFVELFPMNNSYDKKNSIEDETI